MTDSINILDLILHASLVVQVVMVVLLLASIYGWILISRLMGRFSHAQKVDKHFSDIFWSGADLKQLHHNIKQTGEMDGLRGVYYQGFTEFLKLEQKKAQKPDLIAGTERKLRVAIQRQQHDVETGLSHLASIGSVAPYIGLFGTVWGIMNAFLGLSMTSQASLASVAPGIAEALIATALGLFAAIPAVLAYNHYTAKSEALYASRALFCEDLVGLLQRETP